MTSAKRIPIESIVLTVVAAAGFVAVAAVAPGIGPMLQMFGVGKRKSYPKQGVTNAISRLVSKGYIAVSYQDGKRRISLTEKGKKRLEKYNRTSATLKIPKRWDKKWRIVMFDIIEPMKSLRTAVRRELSQAGFIRLQDSVWIYPYDCEEYIALLKTDKRIGKSLLYIVADKVEYDRSLKSLFNLDLKD